MGGGDLNTKKSWHPSTLKNQERVWAAERAAEQERSRIVELQRERIGERERDELRALGRRAGTLPEDGGDKLSWMYNQPNKSGNTEDYLLGKTIDKNYEKLVAEERHSDKTAAPPKNHVEHEVIPFSIRNLRGGASSALDSQVDMVRKLQEDPLAAIKRRELEARTQLLQNPLRLRQLTRMLREEEDKRKEKKTKKKSNKLKSDLDQLLAEKLTGLHDKKIDIASLLSDKKKKKKKKKAQSHSDSDDSCSVDEKPKKKKKRKDAELEKPSNKKKPLSSDSDSDNRPSTGKNRDSEKGQTILKKKRRESSDSEHKSSKKKRRGSLDTEHKSSKKKYRESLEREIQSLSKKKRHYGDSDNDEKSSRIRIIERLLAAQKQKSDEDQSHKKKSKPHESDRRQSQRSPTLKKPKRGRSSSPEFIRVKKDSHKDRQSRSATPRGNSEHHKASGSRKTRHSSSDSEYNNRKKKNNLVERRSKSSSPRKHVERSNEAARRNRRSSSGSDSDRKPVYFGLVAADGRKLQTVRHTEDKNKKSATVVKKEEPWHRPTAERLSEAEKERKRREMMADAAERDVEREQNVARYRAETRREEAAAKSSNFDTEFATRQAARAASGSVQDRIRSNVYNIQRSGRHMDVNFAKR